MKSRRWIIRALLIGLFLASVVFGRPPHPHFWWDYIPGFQAILGFGGSWLLVLLAKSAAARRLERRDDYYDA